VRQALCGKRAVTAFLAVGLGVLAIAAVGGADDGFVDPSTSQTVVAAGGTRSVPETLHLDGFPALPADVVLAFDTTTSMDPLLAAAKADANAVVSGLDGQSVRFAVAQLRDYTSFGAADGVNPYDLIKSLAASEPTVGDAITGLTTADGGAPDEAYFALFHQVANYTNWTDQNWGDGSKRFLVVLGDNSGHDSSQSSFDDSCPTPDVSTDPAGDLVSTTDELVSAAVTLEFLTYHAADSPAGISACHAAMAAKTGGINAESGNGKQIADEIASQLVDTRQVIPTLEVNTVSTVGDADPSQWVSFQKVPESVDVPTDGTDVGFQAVIQPPADAPSGTYTVDIVVRDDGESVLATQTLEFTVGIPLADAILTVDQASVPAGIKDVPLASIPPDRLALTAGSSTSSTPIGSTPIASTPIASTPIASTPIASTPIASTPIASTGLLEAPIASTPIGSTPLQYVLLSQINLIGSTWDTVLCAPLKGKPLNALTLADVAGNACSKTNFEALRLGQVDLSHTLFKGVRWASLIWGTVTFAQMPGGLATWQARITNAGGNGAAIAGSDTPLGADIAGVLGSTAIGAAPIASTPIASTPIASTPIASTHVTSSRLGSVRLGDMTPAGNIVNCNAVDCVNGTLGNAYSASAILPTATFGSAALTPALDAAGITVNDIVVSLLAASDFPWEQLPVQGLQAVAGTGQNATYHLKVSVDCSAISSFHAAVELPKGFFPVAGTSTLSFGGGANIPTGDPALDDVFEGPTPNEYNWDVGCPEGADGTTDAVLSFQAYAGLTLGPDQTSNATVSVDDFVLNADNEAPIAVTENWGSNDEAATAPQVAPDHLLVGHIGTSGDQDFFRLPLTGLARGTRITVYLSHIANGADFDLTVGKPSAQGFFSSPIASTPIASTPIEDNGVTIDNSGLAVPSEALQDIAVGSAPIASTPIASTSTTRGNADELAQFVTQGESGFATIGVTGYNGSSSNEPYVLRVKETPPPTLPTNCPAPPFPGGSPASIASGKLPTSIPSTTKALFLVNKQRLTALYGAPAVTTLLTALNTLAARPEVAGSVVFVDGDAAVRSAYASWDANRCSPAAANDVVRSINDVVAGYRATTSLPSLHYIVLLGGDDAIPMARTPDPVTLSPEVNEANDLAFTTNGLTTGNPLYASAATDNILSDGAYGVLTSIPWLGRELLLSQLSVARLVESPADMTGQINRYVAQNGQINPSSGTVTGYDFLADGAAAVRANLSSSSLTVSPTLGGHAAIGSDWTNGDLKTGFLQASSPAQVGAVNGHYNHFEAEAGDGSLVNTKDATAALVDRVLFTMGCHGGLNVPDGAPVATTPNPYFDWPQLYATKQVAMYLANTGYGYGDDGSVALSERLMALFAKKLHSDGGSVGEQWVAALQQYFATAGAYDVYDEKVMEETTFYGLPFWHYQTAGTATPPGPISTSVDSVTGTPAATVHFPAAGDDTHTQFGLYRPNLPITSQEVTAAAGPARGLWISDLTTNDAAATARIGYPTVDLAAHEPKPNLRPIFFPASPFTLERSIVFGKQRDFVNVSDQFRPDGVGPLSGTQRSITDATFKVLYSFSSDTSPPLISQVHVTFGGTSAVVEARITDDSRVADAAALVHLAGAGNVHWLTVPLVRDPGDPTLYVSAPITTASDPEVFVEATDGVSVSYSANKGLNFNSASASLPAGPRILIKSPAGPYEAGQSVTASYQCLAHPASVTSCTGTVPTGGAVDTAAPGQHTFVVTSTDADGHATSLVRSYTVLFPFRGFFQPISNEPVVNKVNAGRAIPVKFGLGGNRGLDIFAPGYPISQPISCDAGAPTDVVDSTVTAGQSSLSYEAGSDQYNYVWKTDSSWANSCRILVLKTKDGAVHSARFQFK
jgi:uncharacterized protein YjbI with pentapeptide repeats